MEDAPPASDTGGVESAPPSAGRGDASRRDNGETSVPAKRAPVTTSQLDRLRAEVLAAAEGAMGGDEVSAVSAMVTATETAALREATRQAMGEMGEIEGQYFNPNSTEEEEAGKATLAVVFGARRHLGLEVGGMDGTEVFGRRSCDDHPASGSRGGASSGAPSSWPDSTEALRELGYSEGGWESAKTATATEDNTPGRGQSFFSHPADVASQLAMSASMPVTVPASVPASVPAPRFETENPIDENMPTPKVTFEGDKEGDGAESDVQKEDPEVDLTGGTQDDGGVSSSDAPDEETEGDAVGGTQVEEVPEEEDGVALKASPMKASPSKASPKPSPRASSRSPVGAPPAFLRLVSKPATTLKKRLSMDIPSETPGTESIPATVPAGAILTTMPTWTPATTLPADTPADNNTPKENPASLWQAAAATAGFKTPLGGDAKKNVAVAATSPFPLSAPVGTASATAATTTPSSVEIVPETAAPAFETEKTMEAEPLRETGEKNENEHPGGTPAEVMCSYIPSTFPASKQMTMTESTVGGSVAGVEGVAAAAAEAAEGDDEVPLTEVPLSVAPSQTGAKPFGARGGALAAAMHAQRQRNELGADGASMSLGPPTDDTVEDRSANKGLEAPSRDVAMLDASQPVLSITTNPMVVENTPAEQFTPFDLTVPEDHGHDQFDDREEVNNDRDEHNDADINPDDPSVSNPAESELQTNENSKQWVGGWGRVAGDRRGDRAAPPRDVGKQNKNENPTQESPEEDSEEDDDSQEDEEEHPASPDFCLMLSQQMRDVVTAAAADAPSQSMAPPPLRRQITSSAATDLPQKQRRNSSIAAQQMMQKLWDEKEARDAADATARKSARDRKPRKFFGDSQFPSQSQGDEDEKDNDNEMSDSDDVSDPDESDEDGTHVKPTGATPLAKRRAPRQKKPRRFFGDSQDPSQEVDEEDEEEEDDANEDDDDDEAIDVDDAVDDDEDKLEICESDEDEAPWYVGGTQAVPDMGAQDEDEDEDSKDDAPLPPMDDEDDEDDDEDDAENVTETEPGPLSLKRARRASVRVPTPKVKALKVAKKTAMKKTATKIPPVKPQPKGKGKFNPNWKGPLPKLGCPKCRHAAKGCGRCRAICAHAEFGTPLPWRAKTVGGVQVAPNSAPAAIRGNRRVRFDDESERQDEKKTKRGSSGSVSKDSKRRRTSAAGAIRSSLSSLSGPRTTKTHSNVSERTVSKTLSTTAIETSNERRRSKRASTLFDGLTFLLSGLPSRDEVEDITDVIETHGGMVRRDVPPPTQVRQIAGEDLYQPSQDVGAPMVAGRREKPGRNTRVITPAAGRTLKCLYASAVNAALVTPDWVHDSIDKGAPMPLSDYRVDRTDDSDSDSDDTEENFGGLFDGVVVSLSGDTNYVKQFGLLLRHAGAEVVPLDDLLNTVGENVPMGEGPCDYVLIQTAVGAGKGGQGNKVDRGIARASKRLGVPCVRHEWAVDSLLGKELMAIDAKYRMK